MISGTLSHLLANLPNNAAILIAAISGRSLAAAARRAGLRPLVADLFNDADTLKLAERAVKLHGSLEAGIDPHAIVETLAGLAGEAQPVALVYGSGFERRPEMLEAIAKRFSLGGNAAGTVRLMKEPASLASLCHEFSIPHPEIRFDNPLEATGWLTKLGGGAGGSHVKRLNGHSAIQPPLSVTEGSRFEHNSPQTGHYFQRFVEGKNLSALFLADATTAHIVGFSRQWPSPHPGAPFRYGGAVRLRRYDRGKALQIEAWLSALTQRAGLVGLCSADFIEAANGLSLIEINPRPGATLDIFDSDGTPLLREHLRAVAGASISVPAYRGSAASAIAYTNRPIRAFPPVDWPAMTADHQTSGTPLSAGDPVCTVFASASSAAAAERAVRHRVRTLAINWEEDFA